MNLDSIASVAGSIVTVALVTTLVSSPQTQAIVRALGDAFSGSLRAAMGN